MLSTCGEAARWAGRIVLAVGVSCAAVIGAHASPIAYTFSGTGTGTIGTTPFTGAAITITAVGDTAGVTSSAGVYCNHLTSVAFSIAGIGSGFVTDPLGIFDSTGTGYLGLQRGASCPAGNDWLDINAAVFLTYHLDTGTGPVSLPQGTVNQGSVATLLGVLSFSDIAMATFQATLGGPAAHAGAGQLDPTFGSAGTAILAADPAQTNYAYVNAIAVQPDAKIVMLGYAIADGNSIHRLTAYGDLDAGFGTGGRADARVGNAFGLALQPDGKLVVGGSAGMGFGLVRFNANGTVDTSFASNVYGSFGSLGVITRKLLLQPDGKIIAIGFTNYADSATYNAIALARYLPDGSLDATFGSGGTQSYNTDGGSSISPVDAVLQNDGKIAIVGYRFGTEYSPLLLRFSSAGQVDSGFVTTAPGAMNFELLFGVVVQADGKLVISGSGRANAMHARLNADGTPDVTYGTAGVATAAAGGPTSYGRLILQPDGKVLSLLLDQSESSNSHLIRLTAAGALDATFGSGGIAAMPATIRSIPRSLGLQADGKILVAGEIDVGTGSGTAFVAHYGVWRYLGDEITGTIVEYFNTILGHYFITASAAEQASIDAGGSGPGWTRTGHTFRSGGVSRACRFYGTPGLGPNSHFYTIDPAECALVKTDPGWHFESYDFSATPPVAGGSCGSGTVQVYRAYNRRFAQNDSNHRYTTDLSVYNAQVAAGWAGEWVVFCAPL